MVTIGIMDYKAGNIRSVLTAIQYLGARGIISDDPEVLRKCDKLIIPGDGEAQAVMEVLNTTELGGFLREYFRSGKPILGICIGCQIVLERSEERSTNCLGFIPGEVVRFPRKPGLKVPHMGWNQVHHENSHPVFHGVLEDSPCYFVHSYYPVPRYAENAAAWTEYGVPFVSALKKENLVALQFHPEKSAAPGLKMIENFIFRC
ncbi:MAG: imidazole glycerol phosphate synthase subunit HisH [Spirochaetales bacterium]